MVLAAVVVAVRHTMANRGKSNLAVQYLPIPQLLFLLEVAVVEGYMFIEVVVWI